MGLLNKFIIDIYRKFVWLFVFIYIFFSSILFLYHSLCIRSPCIHILSFSFTCFLFTFPFSFIIIIIRNNQQSLAYTPPIFRPIKIQNEPVLSYLEGSKEREILRNKLNHYLNNVTDIPILIDGKEYRTDTVSKKE